MKAVQKSFSLIAAIVLMTNTGCTYSTSVKEKKDSGQKKGTVAAGKPDEADTNKTRNAKPDETGSSAWLLIPGKSAGQTSLNENADKVYQKLGPPDGGDAAMQKAIAVWYTNHDSTSHSVAIYTQRETEGNAPPALIKQIRITSPTFKTAEGIGPGSSLNQIKSALEVKQTEQYSDEGTAYKVYDSPKGIAFEIGPGGNCVAVVIHEAGVTGESTYLKFRTTNKFINRKKV